MPAGRERVQQMRLTIGTVMRKRHDSRRAMVSIRLDVSLYEEVLEEI